jgi:PTS system mannose-specific IIA component
MIGMILVTHGRLAEELRSAMEHVVGRQRNVDTVCIGPEDDIDNRRAEIEACITRCDTGDGVVLLTDMFGGTPSNLAISMMQRQGVEVIAGVNLPMLVKLAVPARSIMGLMMLGAGKGATLELRADGWDAKEALDALVALIESGFDEQG